MTTLNTIIEEETKWEDDFRKQFDELKLKPPKNSMPNAERELIIWYFRNRITTAMQRAYEAGAEAERERIQKRIVNAVAFFDRDTEKARGARYGLEFLLSSFTPPPDNK